MKNYYTKSIVYGLAVAAIVIGYELVMHDGSLWWLGIIAGLGTGLSSSLKSDCEHV